MLVSGLYSQGWGGEKGRGVYFIARQLVAGDGLFCMQNILGMNNKLKVQQRYFMSQPWNKTPQRKPNQPTNEKLSFANLQAQIKIVSGNTL